MKTARNPDPQGDPLEQQLLGINAKIAPYPAARSWSGGRRRVVGKEAFECYTYHVMSRTCGGEVFFDDVEPSGARSIMRGMTRRGDTEAFIKRRRSSVCCGGWRISAA